MERTDLQTLDTLYKKAADSGSPLASANVALIHLSGARLELAMPALESADRGGAFRSKPEITKAISEAKTLLATPYNDAEGRK